MNKVEEVYVSCNSRKWFPAYIPNPQQNLTDKCESDVEEENVMSSRNKSSLMRWQTETTLADFDKQLEAFDNAGLEIEDGDSDICLDESSIDLDSTINSVCVSLLKCLIVRQKLLSCFHCAVVSECVVL